MNSEPRQSSARRRDAARRTPVRIPSDVLADLGARVLDPATAARLPDQPELRATAYVGNSLLVAGLPGGSADAVIAELEKIFVVEPDGKPVIRVEVSDRDQQVARALDGGDDPTLRRLADQVWSTRVTLVPTDPAEPPPDSFTVLQRLRGTGAASASRVSLNHVLAASGIGGVGYRDGHAGIGGTGYWGGHGYWDGHGTEEYGVPGLGGRAPVALTTHDPALSAAALDRSPVVAIPDTGLGTHAWFATGQVEIGATWRGLPLTAAELGNPDAEDSADLMTGQLDPLAGHGTFIAGLIRQGCPQAAILSLPVMSSAGVVVEADLLDTLALLLLRHVDGQQGGHPEQVIDVLSLSLGYYHETPADDLTDQQFGQLLRGFGEAGVLVVAAAGNDSSIEPLYPAGFAGGPPTGSSTGSSTQRLPLASVGATNPGGGTVALFSNAGPWVSTYRPGAALVSTMPQNFDGPGQESVETAPSSGLARGTIDPDDYTGGFGTWSGTSFSAPVLAAELAASLARSGTLAATDAVPMLGRGWEALKEVLSWNRS